MDLGAGILGAGSAYAKPARQRVCVCSEEKKQAVACCFGVVAVLVLVVLAVLYFTLGCGSSAPCGIHTESYGCGLTTAGSCFADAYTLAGCADPAHCGLFRRVLARCTSGDSCPGGEYEYSGSTDLTLCHGAPAYQRGGGEGPVLYRFEGWDDTTGWRVADSSALDTCSWNSLYLESATIDQPGPPTAPAYSTGTNAHDGTGWRDNDASPRCTSDCGITVTAGGR
jgi:hypothetical protein